MSEQLKDVSQDLRARVDEVERASVDLRNLLDGTQIAAVFTDRSANVRSYTPMATALLELAPSERGRPIADIKHRLESLDLQHDVQQAIQQRKSVERTVRMIQEEAFYRMRVLPYRTVDDEVDGALITFVNITAAVVAKEQQRLLVAELNHRVRNMLQVVMGLANQTLHRSTDLHQFRKAFFGRMQALAQAYELLSRDGWHEAPVRDLLRIQLSAFANEGERYSAEGEPVTLTADAALSLGLVLYELATNATKYGALSVPTGLVHVSWHCEARANGEKKFILQWRESGGPAVKPPTRHGFGTELVQRQLKYELNGTATMDFVESGLVVTLEIPTEEAIEPRAASGKRK